MIHTINGTAVASQESCVVEINTQSTEDSTRDLTGYMHNTFLPFKYKINAKWPPQTFAARATIVGAIVGAPNPSYLEINFDDPATGTASTKYFMMGTPLSQEHLIMPANYWSAMEIHFIEL